MKSPEQQLQQQKPPEQQPVTFWDKLCVDYPAAVMAATLFVCLALTSGAMANFPTLAEGGFEASDSLVQQRIDAMFMLEIQTLGEGSMYLFYEAKNGNALDEANLKRMCEFETAMFSHKNYPALCNKEEIGGDWTTRTCAPMISLVPLLFEMDLPGCSSASQRCINTCTLKSDWHMYLRYLVDPTMLNNTAQINMYQQYRTILLGNDITNYGMETGSTPVKSRYARSMLNSHDYNRAVSEILNPVSFDTGMSSPNAPLRCYFWDQDAFLNQLISDMGLVVVSVAVVFFYMWYNTQSLFLTLCGIFEIIISFPIAFFFWGTVMDQHHFNILQMMVLFIILGIGADDIFVLQDAWRQSAVQDSATISISGRKDDDRNYLYARFAWSYRRAAMAMTVTTFTTFMAFISAALTPVPAIRAMGIFAALVVLFDYLLVISWFAASLQFHDRFFHNKSAAESLSAMRGSAASCCFGSARVVDGLPVVADSEKNEKAVDLFHSSKCCCCIPAPCCIPFPPPSSGNENDNENEQSRTGNDALGRTETEVAAGVERGKLRRVERGFYDLASVLHRHNKALLSFFAVLFICAVVVTGTMLKPAEQLPGMFPSDHPISRILHISSKEFGMNQDDKKIQMQVVWGLDINAPVDRGSSAKQILPSGPDSAERTTEDGSNSNNDTDKKTADLDKNVDKFRNGHPVYDPTFMTDAGQQRLQTEMVAFCEAAPVFGAFSSADSTDATTTSSQRGLLKHGLVSWNKHRANMSDVGAYAGATGSGYDYDSLRAQDSDGSGYEVYCIMRHLRDFVQSQTPAQTQAGVACPVWPCATGRSLVRALTDGNFSQYLQSQENKKSGPTLFGRSWWYNAGGFSGYQVHVDEDYGPFVQAAWAAFNTTIPVRDSIGVTEIKQWHAAWEDAVRSSGINAFATCPLLWSWMALVEVLLKSSVVGIAISVVLAYAVLLIATTNVIVTTMAIVSILGIMLSVFMTMVFLGWEISVLESISMIVVVGMSVDYTVHLMHAYHECDSLLIPARFDKARAAMAEMGVSVFSGALTTFLAACPLFFAQFVFFSQFGAFIAMITLYSIVWAIFFLMTLVTVVGPEATENGNGYLFGEITICKKNKNKAEKIKRIAADNNESVYSAPD